MGRDWEGDGEADYLDMGRWEWNSRRVMLSARGQRWLRELEAALLAMTDKRLVRGLAEVRLEEDGFGERVETPLVCAVGTLALYKGVSFDDLEPEGTATDTIELAENLGMAPTMAAIIGDENDKSFTHVIDRLRYGYHYVYDETTKKNIKTPATSRLRDYLFDHETPEDRYVRMLAWVRSQILEPVAA